MGSVICSAVRTPLGRYGGALASLSAMQLGGAAIGAALERVGLTGDQIDEVYFGHVIQAGCGQITSRQAALLGGIPMTVPSTTINKVCLSGMASIALADKDIRLGEARLVMAGGMESMSTAPYAVPSARWGARMGEVPMVDLMEHDGLFCAFDKCLMGATSDRRNAELGITRAEQDEWSVMSHQRAAAAADSGLFADEITPVPVPQRKGDPVLVTADEGIRRDSSVEGLARLRPAFSKEGTITAGNSSQISDGAAALVVADSDTAAAAGLPVIAEIVAYGQAAGPDATLHERPAQALQAALDGAGLSVHDLILFEMNEAFACVALWSARLLEIPPEKVNVHGGAVALGHPLGATGARLVVTLINALRRAGGGLGGAALCGGGGQGDALIINVPG